MRPEPGNAAKKGDHQRRYRPDDKLEMPGEGPVGEVFRARIRGTKPPSKPDRRQYHGDHDGKHYRQRIEENEFFGSTNSAMRIEHAAASCQRQGEKRHSGN